jgi:hypothetical protein
MNSTDFERARTLLPSFLKKTISANDKAWMTQFIQNLQDKSLNLDEGKVRQFNDEMAWVELSQGQLDNTMPAFDSEAGWKKMAMQLEISPLAQPAQPSHPLQAPHDKKKRSAFDLMKLLINAKFGPLIELWRKPMVGVLASTMIVAQMGLLAALVKIHVASTKARNDGFTGFRRCEDERHGAVLRHGKRCRKNARHARFA